MATRQQPSLRACRLADAPLPDLLGLIAEERRDWRQRLLWDPRELGDALEMAASARLLPGVAVLDGGRAVAYASVHASGASYRPCSVRLRRQAPPESAQVLVEALLALPEAEERRLEAQLTAFEWQDALDEAFAARGVGVARRRWLHASLASEEGTDSPHAAVRPWSGELLEACADLLAAAHAGGVEARINASFEDPSSSAGYLREVVRGPGCGHLLPWASSVAVLGGRVAGFCLVTTVSPGVAHVPQVAVHPRHQGRGLGDALLGRARRCAAAEGCHRVTLSVSEENQRAGRWYEARGFQELERFSAYWQ